MTMTIPEADDQVLNLLPTAREVHDEIIKDGRPMTRRALATGLRERGKHLSNERIGELMWLLGLRGARKAGTEAAGRPRSPRGDLAKMLLAHRPSPEGGCIGCNRDEGTCDVREALELQRIYLADMARVLGAHAELGCLADGNSILAHRMGLLTERIAEAIQS